MTFGLMYGLYSRTASNQERLMMARVRYILLFDKPVSIYEFENEFEYVVVKLMSERLCCLYYFHKNFVVLEDLLQRNSRFSYY